MSVPVIVDADNGYGNEDNVIRTVYELEHAGAAAIIMEDQIFPKRCGHAEQKAVVPLAHYLKKLDCALKRRETPLCIIGRTDARPIEEAIARAKALHAAGADVTLIDGLASLDDAKRVCDEVPGHKHVNLIYGGKTELLSAPELAKLGFKVVLYSTPALYVAVKALTRDLRILSETHDLRSISTKSITFGQFQGFIEETYMRQAHDPRFVKKSG